MQVRYIKEMPATEHEDMAYGKYGKIHTCFLVNVFFHTASIFHTASMGTYVICLTDRCAGAKMRYFDRVEWNIGSPQAVASESHETIADVAIRARNAHLEWIAALNAEVLSD